YGVEAAAQRYFGVSAADVTLAQAASLIAIVQYPMERNLAQPENFQANEDRRNVILKAMLDAKSITQAQYDEAIATAVDENFVNLTTPDSGCIAADEYSKFFCDYVVKNVTNYEALGATKDERLTNWHIGGYKLYTTMNYTLQKVAQKQAWRAPKTMTGVDLGSATSSIEVGTGRVLTMAQNKLFNDTLEGGGKEATAVNFNTDRDYGGSSGFQTGSTYKIMALLTWLKAGRGLNELVNASDFKKDQANYVDTCKDSGAPYGGTWEFKNDSAAPEIVNVLDAVKWSINSAFASIAEQLDQCDIRNTAESLGVHRADGATLQSNPSAVLGTNELAPLTMAAAWAGIANEGKFCTPILLDHVEGPNGEALPGQTTVCNQAVDPEVANAAIYAMKGVMNGGTGAASNPGDGVPIFGKTGTTDNSTQTWILTSTSRVASVAWVGNIVGKVAMREVYYRGVQAAIIRHLMMSTIMRYADRMYSGETDWPNPPSRLLQGNGVKVPAVRGLTIEAATALLKGLGFEVRVGRPVESMDVEEGLVYNSSPDEGKTMAKGMTVTIRASAGWSGFTMPDFLSNDYVESEALTQLHDLGATSITVHCQSTTDTHAPHLGYVIDQYPMPGEAALTTTSFSITVLKTSC
ncbi:MAG: hypothetical protein RLZZ319_577, partial [Actinomycetota bacterium]